jgi:hypothetical protein
MTDELDHDLRVYDILSASSNPAIALAHKLSSQYIATLRRGDPDER